MAIDLKTDLPDPLVVACDKTVNPKMRSIAFQMFQVRAWADAVAIRGLRMSSLEYTMRDLVAEELRLREIQDVKSILPRVSCTAKR